jgi:hypothetical protein
MQLKAIELPDPAKIADKVVHTIEEATDNLCCPERRQVVSRFFFSLMTMLIVALGFNSPEAITYYMIQQGGWPAILSSLVMLTASALAFFDVLLNDILPPRFSFFLDRKKRYLLWGTMGATYIGYAFILTKLNFSTTALVLYSLFGLWATTIGVMDVIYELNERSEKNANT